MEFVEFVSSKSAGLVIIVLKFQVTTVWEWRSFPVCRTASATPGLLNIHNAIHNTQKSYHYLTHYGSIKNKWIYQTNKGFSGIGILLR